MSGSTTFDPEKPFSCSVCQKNFATERSQKIHEVVIHDPVCVRADNAIQISIIFRPELIPFISRRTEIRSFQV